MPIYEYKCSGCGSHIEKMQKVSDEPLKTCEACGGDLKKQISRAGFQFKGEGWYVTDYAGKKSDTGEKQTEKAEKSSGGESTAKGESASNKGNDTAKSSKTDTTAKKD